MDSTHYKAIYDKLRESWHRNNECQNVGVDDGHGFILRSPVREDPMFKPDDNRRMNVRDRTKLRASLFSKVDMLIGADLNWGIISGTYTRTTSAGEVYPMAEFHLLNENGNDDES